MLLTVVKNSIRTIFMVRQPRELPPPGPKPAFGSTIVLGRLKIQLLMAIDYEQWDWLTDKGWRTMEVRNNRRRYYKVPRKAVSRLLHATPDERDDIHQQILDHRYDKSRLC
ncbi:MAG: hypothetical protein KGM99_14425 [Burkholderiales bacterium]|nr:hypothetical protein [Burkholderiales bacterium]